MTLHAVVYSEGHAAGDSGVTDSVNKYTSGDKRRAVVNKCTSGEERTWAVRRDVHAQRPVAAVAAPARLQKRGLYVQAVVDDLLPAERPQVMLSPAVGCEAIALLRFVPRVLRAMGRGVTPHEAGHQALGLSRPNAYRARAWNGTRNGTTSRAVRGGRRLMARGERQGGCGPAPHKRNQADS